MKETFSTDFTRRGVLAAFAAFAVTAAPSYSRASGIIRNSGDVRRLSMYSRRTGESINTIYWVDGKYIPEALNEINRLMRDWRQNEVKKIDIRTIDIMAAAHVMMDTKEPYQLLSGYRSAKTNALLRRSSRRVASKSLHISGQAADLRLTSRSVRKLSRAALSCKSGGVGTYSRSGFVHMDCGPIRSWGR